MLAAGNSGFSESISCTPAEQSKTEYLVADAPAPSKILMSCLHACKVGSLLLLVTHVSSHVKCWHQLLLLFQLQFSLAREIDERMEFQSINTVRILRGSHLWEEFVLSEPNSAIRVWRVATQCLGILTQSVCVAFAENRAENFCTCLNCLLNYSVACKK